MDATGLLITQKVASMHKQVKIIMLLIFLEGEFFQLKVFFLLIHQPQQYGRICHNNGYLSLQPVDSMCLLCYERFLVLIAAVQKVESTVPNKFFGILGNILR